MPSGPIKKQTKLSTPWLSNAMKSIGSTGVSEVSKLFPNLQAFTTEIAGTAKDAQYSGISGITNSIMSNKYVKAAKTAIKNIEQDLKTGNFNNEARSTSAFLGGDSDSDYDNDFSKALGGFSFGDADNGEEELSPESSALVESNFMISDKIGKQTKAQMKSSKANLQAMVAIQSARMSQIQNIGTGVIDQLTNVNTNLSTLINYNNDNFSKFIEASMSFYENVGASISAKQHNRSRTNDKVRAADIFRDRDTGGITLSKYKKYVQEQLNSGQVAMINSLLNEEMLNAIVANPLGAVTGAVINKLIPSVIKETSAGIEKSFSTFIPAMLTHISSWADEAGKGIFGEVKRFIGKNFGLKVNDVNSINRGGTLIKGPVDFDGITRHTIVELIPKELRRQTEYLKLITNGKKLKEYESVDDNLKAYDFMRGEETTVDRINNNIINEITGSIVSSMMTGEFGTAIRKEINNVNDESQQEKLNDTLERLLVLLSQNNIEDVRTSNSKFTDLVSEATKDKKLQRYIGGIFDNLDDITRMDYRGRVRISGRSAKENIIQSIKENPEAYGLYQSTLDFTDLNSEIYKRQQEAIRNEERSIPGMRNPRNGESVNLPVQKVQFRQKYKKSTGNDAEFSGTNYSVESGEGLFEELSNNIRSAGNHFQGALVSLLNNSPDLAFKHITAVFKDSGSHLLKMVDEGFIKPLKDKLFGNEKDGSEGIFSSFSGMISDLGNEARHIVTGKEYIDHKGETHEATDNCVFGDLANALTDIRDGIIEKFFGNKKKKDPNEPGVIDGVLDTFEEGANGWIDALFGSKDDTKEKIQETYNKFKEYTKENIPSAIAGGIKGGIFGAASGGLLGALIGGPIGGAILGTTIGFAKKSEAFQNFVFGQEAEDGSHVGGIISDKVQKWYKENRHAVIGGAAIGAGKAAIFGSSSGILTSLVGGPIAGALLGVAATTVARSKMFHDFIFGNPEEGQRGILKVVSDQWKKLNINNPLNGTTPEMKKTLGMGILGAAGGALTAGLIGKLGFFGAAMTPFGPLGGAVLGVSAAMLAQKENIHDWLFGTKDRNEFGERQNPGVLGQFGNLLNAYIFRPASTGVENMIEEASIYLKHDVLFNAKVILERAIAPIVESAAVINEQVSGLVKDVKSYVDKTFIKPFFSIVQKAILKPISSIGSILAKTALSVGTKMVTTPMKLVAKFLKPVGDTFKFVATHVIPITKALGKITRGLSKVVGFIGKIGKFGFNVASLPLRLLGSVSNVLSRRMDENRRYRYQRDITSHQGDENTLDTEIRLNREAREIRRMDLRKKKRADKDKRSNEQQIAKFTNGMIFEDTAENRRHAEVLAGKKLKWKGNASELPKIKRDSDLNKENPDDQTLEERDHVIFGKILENVENIANNTNKEKREQQSQSSSEENKSNEATNTNTTNTSNNSTDNSNNNSEDGFDEARRSIRDHLDNHDARLADHRGGDYGDLSDVFESGMEKYGIAKYMKNVFTPSYIKEKYNSKTYLGGLFSALANPRFDATEHNDNSLDDLSFEEIRELNRRYTQSDHNENNGGHGTGHPYYSQNDPRWKNRPYGGYGPTMGTSGCGPTALAMALSEVSGRQITPTELADFAVGSGTRDESGTNWNFISKASNAYGVKSKQQIFPTNQSISSALDNGPVVLSGKEGGYGVVTSLLGLGGSALLSLGKGALGLVGKGITGIGHGIADLMAGGMNKFYGEEIATPRYKLKEKEEEKKDNEETEDATASETKKAYLKAKEKGYTADEKHQKAEEERAKKKEEQQTRLAQASLKVQRGIKSGISSAFGNKGLITLLLLSGFSFVAKNWDKVKGAFSSISSIGSFLIDTAKPILNTIGSAISGIADWLGIDFDKTGEALKSTASKTVSDTVYGLQNLEDGKSSTEILSNDVNRVINGLSPLSLSGYTDENGDVDQLGKDLLYANYKLTKNTGKKIVKHSKTLTGLSNTLSTKIADEQAARIAGKTTSTALNTTTKELATEGLESTTKLAAQEGTESLLKTSTKDLGSTILENSSAELSDKTAQSVLSESGKSLTDKVSGDFMNASLTKNSDDKEKIITKLIGYIKDAFDFLKDKLGIKSTGKLTGLIEKVNKFIKNQIDKITTKIAKIIGSNAVLSALTGGIGFLLKDSTQFVIHGLDGLTGASRLFRINKDYVTPLMRVISSGFSGVLSTTAGAILQIVADVYESSTGTSLLSEIAYFFYSVLAKEEDVEKLDEGQQAFKDEYDNYKSEEIQKQYQNYILANNLSSSEYTLDDFMKDADDGKVTVKYKGFTEYNNGEHKSVLNAAGDATLSAGKTVKNGITSGASYAGRVVFGGTEAETYYDDATGITYVKKNDDTFTMYDKYQNSLGEINSNNIDTSSMRNMTQKRKNMFSAGWSVITGGSEFYYVDPESASGKKNQAEAVQKSNSELESENILTSLSWNPVTTDDDDAYDDTTVWYTADGCYYIKNEDGNYDKCNIYGNIINGQTLAPNELELLKNSNLLFAGEAADTSKAKLAVDSIISANESYWTDAEKTIRKNTSTYKKANKTTNKTTTKSNLDVFKNANNDLKNILGSSNTGIGGGFGENLNGHPYYSQNDSRWSNIPYETIGSGGCGPSAMAMAMEDITGKDVNPVDMATLAQISGDRDNTGTNWNFVSDAAGAYGIGTSQTIAPSKNELSSALNSGKPVVLSGRSGGYGRSPYTPAGHYVVAVGKDDDGNVIINDPRGKSYSGKYNLADVARETGSAWSFGGYGSKRGGKGVLDKIGTVISNFGTKAFEGLLTGKFDTNFDSWGASSSTASSTGNKIVNAVNSTQTTSTGTFSKLVMFGDSRTHGMAIAKGASGNGDVYTAGNNIFVAKDGMGYDWFSSTAINLGKQYIDSNTAVVVWFGVNDLDNVAKYAALVNSFPSTYGCKVYYMSVTPCDLTAKADFNNSIKAFNSTLKSSLLSSITFIDSYGYVEGKMSTGEYVSPDKLHYNNTTYNGIYDYMMSKVGSLSGGGSGLRKLRNKIKSIRQKFTGGGFGESLNGFSYYSQNDPAWKNVDYSGDMNDGATIGDTGCGPVAMSMVASQINGIDITPTELSQYAIESGNRDNTGTNWNFISNAANAYGINSTRLTPNATTIESEIDRGNPVILSGTSTGSGRSAYTPAGHYVVAVGRDNAGNIIVNDPRGKSYSGKYNESTLLKQTGSAWSFGRGASGPTSTTGADTQSTRTPSSNTTKSKTSIFDRLTKGSTSSSTTSDTNKPLTKEEQAREAVVGWLLCIVGQNQYSMGSDRTLVGNGVDGHGVGDCSATQAWAYKQGTGLDIGGYTGAQISNSNGEIVKTFPMNTGSCPSEADLLPGDLLFFGSGEAGGNSHVEMYVGNNTLIGHGSGTGPQVKVMTDYAPNSHGGCTYVIRYINSKTINTITVTQPDSSKFKVANTFTNGRGYSGNGANVGGLSTGGSATTTTSQSIFDKISAVTSNFYQKAFEGLATGNFDTNFDSWGASSSSDTSTATSTNATLSSGTLTGNTDAEKVKNYFKSQGLTDAGVAGLMGNLEAESGIRFNNLENQCEAGGAYDVGGYNDETYTAAVDNGTITKDQFLHPLPGKQFGYGLAQWTSPGRKEGLYDLVKSRNVSIADPQAQCDWLMNELNTSYQGVLNTLKTTNSLQEASDKVLVDFESPANAWSQSSSRASLGAKYYGGGSGLGRRKASSPMRIKRFNITGGHGETTDDINYTKIGNTGITRSIYDDTNIPSGNTKIYNNYTTTGNTDELLKTVINVLRDISSNTLTTADKLDYLRQSASSTQYSSNKIQTTSSNNRVLGSNSSSRNKQIASKIARG